MHLNSRIAGTGLLALSQLSEATPSRRDTWFCSGNGASWDESLWQDNSVGDWLNDRIAHYVDGSWPSEVSGMPRTIAEFGGDSGDDHDEIYNWGTHVDGTCDLGESGLKTNSGCEDNSHRAFALWAMRNNARFIQGFYAAITDVFDTSSLYVADIVDTFIGTGGKEVELGASSWLIMLSGAVGATTAFIPLGGAALGGMVSGVMGVGVGILVAAKDVPVDPRFTTFGDLQARLGDMKRETQNTISAYFDKLYSDSPAEDASLNPADELVDLMHDGVWAEQDMAKLGFTKDDMVRLIHAAFITEAWNSQKVVLLKWSNGLLGDIDGTNINPCWEDAGWDEQGINEFVACENDRNFMAIRMGKTSIGPWSVKGWKPEDLEPYGLTQKMIINASEHRQAFSGNWIDRGLDLLLDDFTEWAANPPENIAEAALPFNLPICELDNIDGLEWNSDECFGIAQLCLYDIIKKNCPRLLLNDVPFPYDGEV